MKRIYLDNNATTGLDPRVLEAMLLDLSPTPGNPSSVHFFGQQARSHLTKARHDIADFFHFKPSEVIFTSGGTESLNFILRGMFAFVPQGHILTSNVEHSAVFNTVKFLESLGCAVTYLPAGLWGSAQFDDLQKAVRKDTRLIILGAVNSETGVKTDIETIADFAYAKEIPFAVDGVALLGKESFSIPKGVSAIAFSGHKLHGPKGSGLCLIRSHLKLHPLITGGDQEFSRRAGTENLSGILGIAKAIDLLKTELPTASIRMQTLRDRFEKGLRARLSSVIVNGDGPRVVNTSNLSFLDTDGETLLMNLDRSGIAASHGSACSSGSLEPSRVLTQMGVPKHIAKSSIRFSLSRMTTEEEIDTSIHLITEIVTRLRKIGPQ